MLNHVGTAGRIRIIQAPRYVASFTYSKSIRSENNLSAAVAVGMALIMGLCMKMAVPTCIGQRLFFNGSSPISVPSSTTSGGTSIRTGAPPYVPVRALKMMQGKVVCATNDKTVSVEVVRLAPHPKYKKRVRSKKKYQAHDPDNVFKVGDLVQLKKSAPISKTKAFLALPVPPRRSSRKAAQQPQELSLPLESANT